MPRAVWWEWWPEPTVPVPMARRLVWMPVWPRVTVSEAENLVGRVVLARAVRMVLDESQAAPRPVAERIRNSRRCMEHPREVARPSYEATPMRWCRASGTLCGWTGNWGNGQPDA